MSATPHSEEEGNFPRHVRTEIPDQPTGVQTPAGWQVGFRAPPLTPIGAIRVDVTVEVSSSLLSWVPRTAQGREIYLD